MRIVVLGGAGVLGAVTVGLLVDSGVSEVVIADYNLEGAKKVADQYKGGKSKVSAQFVDVNDHKGLVRTIKTVDPDVVASTVGPFYKYAGKVYRGCIEAGVSCVDICDDYLGTKEALALDKAAKKANITIITGMGDSPGISNLIAKYFADQMDRVDDINIFWVVGAAEGRGIAVIKHSFLTFAGPTHQFLDGRLVEVPGFTGREPVEFDPPIGKVDLMYCDHPEPFTLPLHIKGVKNVTCKGGIHPVDVPNPGMDIWTHVGLTAADPIKVGETSVAPIDFLSAFLSDASRKIEEKAPTFSGMKIEAKGEKEGEPVQYVFGGVMEKGMTLGTPQALATATMLLAEGKIKVKGAYAPEGCIDPELFIKEYTGGMIETLEPFLKAYAYRLALPVG